MKIPRKKTPIVIIPALAVLLFVGLIYLEFAGVTNFFGTPKETAQEAQENLDRKKELATPNNETSTGKPDATDTTEYTPPSNEDNISITISQPNNSEIAVATKLYGYSDGTCKLTVTNSGNTASQSAPVMFQREYSTCAGFTVKKDELGAGSWRIRLDVTSGGITTSKTTTMEVR